MHQYTGSGINIPKIPLHKTKDKIGFVNVLYIICLLFFLINLFIPDLWPKVIGGFTEYKTLDSVSLLGRQFEWGASYQNVDNISHVLLRLTHGYCTWNQEPSYCYQRLIVSSDASYKGMAYDVRGGYIQFIDDGSIAMRWGVNYTSQRFTDTVVFIGKAITSTGIRDAELHFVLEAINGTFQFISEISEQRCSMNTDECNEEAIAFRSGERTSTFIAHEIGRFKCYSIDWFGSSYCKQTIYLNVI